jgi:hypothetical protein
MVAHSDNADLREKALSCLIEATKDTGLNVEACRELGLFEVSPSHHHPHHHHQFSVVCVV